MGSFDAMDAGASGNTHHARTRSAVAMAATAQLNVSSASSIVAAPAAHSRRAAAPRSRGHPPAANAPSVSTAAAFPSQR